MPTEHLLRRRDTSRVWRWAPCAWRGIFVSVLWVPLILPGGCMDVRPWRTHARPWTPELVAGAERVRATRTDGTTVVLEDALVDVDRAELRGMLLGADPEMELSLAMDGLAGLETSRFEGRRLAGNIAMGAGGTALVVILAVGVLVLGYAAALA